MAATNNLTSVSTEKATLAVLMTSPHLRGELLKRYPGRIEKFYSAKEAVELLRAVMSTAGLAVPASVNPQVLHLVETDWSPQRVFDSASFDAAERFWDDIEHIRRLSKKRHLREILLKQAHAIPEAADIDVLARETNDHIARLTADTSTNYDPSIAAIGAQFLEAKAQGKVGQRLPTMIPRLDRYLGGGLRIEPGELVGIAGFEKQRKTSLVRALIASWHWANAPGPTVWVCNEESVGTYDLMSDLWAQEATRLSLQRGLYFEANGQRLPRTFSRDDVMTRDWDSAFADAVKQAYQIITGWDIRIYGSALDEGNAMDFSSVMAQVRADIEFNGAKRVVLDNLQGWREGAEGDYDAMNRVVPGVAALVGNYHILTVALSQYTRDGKIRGSGGFEGRTNLILGTKYDEKAEPDAHNLMVMEIKKQYGRDRPYFHIEDLKIEPRSGLIVDGWWPPAHPLASL